MKFRNEVRKEKDIYWKERFGQFNRVKELFLMDCERMVEIALTKQCLIPQVVK